MKITGGALSTVGLISLITACSNKDPVYYTLSSYPGRIYTYSLKIIEVRISSLAGSLDKDRIVSETDQNQV